MIIFFNQIDVFPCCDLVRQTKAFEIFCHKSDDCFKCPFHTFYQDYDSCGSDQTADVLDGTVIILKDEIKCE